ncbi:MAG: hypothetical protein FJW39_09365 [Acidobacteria bacterium]|nr:hypothetical protein [Acidobacteriota bacterium]
MRYLGLGLLSLTAAVVSTMFWMINPIHLFGWLGGHAVQLAGRQPPFESDYTALFALCFVWPLLIWPVYSLNQRWYGGRGWSLAAMLAGAFFAAGFVTQLWRSSR